MMRSHIDEHKFIDIILISETVVIACGYSWSWLVFSGTEHLVEVLDKLSSTAVDFFRSELKVLI